MKNGIFISILALSLAAITASDVQAQPTGAQCNIDGAVNVGLVQMIAKQGATPSQCEEFIEVFFGFATSGCFDLLNAGELDGIFGTAITQPAGPDEAAAKNLAFTICDAVDACGLCPAALSVGVCGMTCML